jgi:hypothetical protein
MCDARLVGRSRNTDSGTNLVSSTALRSMRSGVLDSNRNSVDANDSWISKLNSNPIP